MKRTLYHGTTADLEGETLDEGFCATTCRRAAEAYADGGTVYVVRLLPGTRIADEDDIREVAAELGYTDHYVFEIVDREDVRAALAARGFGAVQYEDVAPDNEFEHDCYRALVEGVMEIAQ